METLLLNIEHILNKTNPKEELQNMMEQFHKVIPLKSSSKHLIGKGFGRFSKKIA